jgi:hypothetical protein
MQYRPPMTQGAAAILRSRKPAMAPGARPGIPQPVQPIEPLDKVKPRARNIRK